MIRALSVPATCNTTHMDFFIVVVFWKKKKKHRKTLLILKLSIKNENISHTQTPCLCKMRKQNVGLVFLWIF